MEWNDKELAYSVLEQAWVFRLEDDSVLPTWYLRTEQGMVIIGTPFIDPVDSKARQAEAVAMSVKELDAKTVMFVSDAWMRTEKPEGETMQAPGQLRRNKRVSEYIDAVECLTVQVWHCDRTGYTIMRSYRSKDDGKLTILEEKAIDGPAESSTFGIVLAALYQNPCP